MKIDNNFEDFLRVYSRVIDLNTEELRILESIRFKDEDQSGKSASVLAFSGLIIATSIVQLAASSDSILYINKENWQLYTNLLGLIFLFLSSLLSLFALTISFNYSEKSHEALQQFHQLVVVRSNLSRWSTRLTIVGTFFALVSFFFSVVSSVFLNDVVK